jgi:hypothetical protein
MNKRTITTLAALALVASIGLTPSMANAAPAPKVTLCHAPGTEDETTISVSENALAAHLAHGDYVGECVDPIAWVNVDTRSAGHYEYVEDGIHIWTDDATSNAKVSLGLDVDDFRLDLATPIVVEYTNLSPDTFAYGPGVNLFVDFDGNGTVDGTLVYEAVYGQDLWLTGGSAQFVRDLAPVVGGGNGSQYHGTVTQWQAAFPTAKVLGIAFALGSGVHADGILHSITVGTTTYEF